ncbi:MAG: sialidase family protein, partial [Candidatus Hydrogenedentes bacterium]|nr:sialidase family protein [Candidatus Hydrogenedentota bacterium]
HGTAAPTWDWQDAIILKPGEEFPRQLAAGFEALDYHEGMWAEYAPPYHRLLIEAAGDPAKRQMGWMTRIHPFTLDNGRILLPLYSDGFNVSLVAISDDDGETWRASAPMVGLGPIQPTLVQKDNGTLAAYLRDSGDVPNRVMISFSQDNGETWSPATDTELPNPGSSLEAIELESGNWLMILINDADEGRHRLSAFLSDDEGATWKWRRILEPGPLGGNSFSYPSVLQGQDGAIHMTYSARTDQGSCIRYAVITEAWVKNIE